MTLDIYQVDAFANTQFRGNPAAICPVHSWPNDSVMLQIAKENNLAETAFFKHESDNIFHLRWFTPEIEMDLCGHATLASAFVIFTYINPELKDVKFLTQSGPLVVEREAPLLKMSLPSRPALPSTLPDTISRALSKQPKEVFKARDYVLVYETEDDIRQLKVSSSILEDINIDPGGIIVTSKGDHSDFVSRFFTPGAAVFEDPVTGSAHCTLTPFWAERLGTNKLHAIQCSERTGQLWCELVDDRVVLRGEVVSYLTGSITINPL